MKETMEVGNVVSVRCKTHGNRKLIAGTDFSVESEIPPSCPFCRVTLTGPLMCGTSWSDLKGVRYVVDEQGRIRHFSKLSEAEAERISEGKVRVELALKKFMEERKNAESNSDLESSDVEG